MSVRQPAGSRQDEQDGLDGEERAQVEAAVHLAHPVHPVQHTEVTISSRTRARMRRSEARMKPGVRREMKSSGTPWAKPIAAIAIMQLVAILGTIVAASIYSSIERSVGFPFGYASHARFWSGWGAVLLLVPVVWTAATACLVNIGGANRMMTISFAFIGIILVICAGSEMIHLLISGFLPPSQPLSNQ